MSTYLNQPGFETLKASDSGRRLVSKAGRYEVQAKIFTSEEGDEFLIVRTWIGSRPASPDEGWCEPSRWGHAVFDEEHNIVAQGFGARERDSWAMTERILRLKGIDEGAPRGVAAAKQQKREARREPRSVIAKGGYESGSKPIEAFRPPPKGPGVGGAAFSKRD